MYHRPSHIDGLLETYARYGVVLKSYQGKALRVMRHLGCVGWHPSKFNRVFRKVILHLKAESERRKMDISFADFCRKSGIITQEWHEACVADLAAKLAVLKETLDDGSVTYSGRNVTIQMFADKMNLPIKGDGTPTPSNTNNTPCR